MNLFFTLASAILGTLFVSSSIKAEEGFCTYFISFKTTSEPYEVYFRYSLLNLLGNPVSGVNSEILGRQQVIYGGVGATEVAIQASQSAKLLFEANLPLNHDMSVDITDADGETVHGTTGPNQHILECEVSICPLTISSVNSPAAWAGRSVEFYAQEQSLGTFVGNTLTLQAPRGPVLAVAAENTHSSGLQVGVTYGSNQVSNWLIGSLINPFYFRSNPCTKSLPSSPFGGSLFPILSDQEAEFVNSAMIPPSIFV